MATSYESTALNAVLDDALSGDRDETALIKHARAHEGWLRIAGPGATFRQVPDDANGEGPV